MTTEKKLLICLKCPHSKSDGSGEAYEGAPNDLICEKYNNFLIRGFASCESCPIGKW